MPLAEAKIHYTRSKDFLRATATVVYDAPLPSEKLVFPYTAIDIDSMYIKDIAVVKPDKINGTTIGHRTVFYESSSEWRPDEEYILEKALTHIELSEFFNV